MILPADSTAGQRTCGCTSLTWILNSPGLREVVVRIHVSGWLGESQHLQREVASQVRDPPRQPEPHTQHPCESPHSSGLEQVKRDFQGHTEKPGDTLLFLCQQVPQHHYIAQQERATTREIRLPHHCTGKQEPSTIPSFACIPGGSQYPLQNNMSKCNAPNTPHSHAHVQTLENCY